MYQERVYRKAMDANGLYAYTITEFESDLLIHSDQFLPEEARKWIQHYRNEIISYSRLKPNFIGALTPQTCLNRATPLVKHLHRASQKADVGPMAAVAGGISEYVGRKLLKLCDEVMIENGGDIFLKSNTEKRIKIYAGDSALSNQLTLKIKPYSNGVGICTSAGRVGHSLSFGNADAVVVISKDTLLADAVATATGNIIKTQTDISKGIDFAKGIEGIEGIVIIAFDQIGAWGAIEIC